MLRESGYFRKLIASYHYEPHTERAFFMKDALRERLRAFESKCRSQKDPALLGKLLREFSQLQQDTFAYIAETGTGRAS